MDIDNGFQSGKPQWDLTLHPTASVLGLSERDLGRQVRAAFFGSEALRQQRGRMRLESLYACLQNKGNLSMTLKTCV